MTRLLTKKQELSLKKDIKTHIRNIVTIAVLGFVVLSFITIYRHTLGRTLALMLSMFISFFIGGFIYFIISTKIVIKKHILKLYASETNHTEIITCTFISNKEQTETKLGLPFAIIETRIKNEDKEIIRNFYWPLFLRDITFNHNQILQLEHVDNIILKVEVIS